MSELDRALQFIREGKPVVLVDDVDREWEGDIVISAKYAQRESLIFTMLHARGLMCIPAPGYVMDRLGLPPMVESNTDPNQTPFTVSIDGKGTSTGMSVEDRMTTLDLFVNPETQPEDFTRPGHMFPLRARDGLLEERRGHTEGSVELMKLALPDEDPIAIICEIMNQDGSMTKGDQLEEWANRWDLPFISIEDIYERAYHSGV